MLLGHPGGPHWSRKDEGAWTMFKGGYEPDEPPEVAARREFREETGFTLDGPLIPLGEIRQPSGKWVTAYALEGDVDATLLRSNYCELEWPPRSGRTIEIPEIDRGAWFTLADAERYLTVGQRPFVARLREAVK